MLLSLYLTGVSVHRKTLQSTIRNTRWFWRTSLLMMFITTGRAILFVTKLKTDKPKEMFIHVRKYNVSWNKKKHTLSAIWWVWFIDGYRVCSTEVFYSDKIRYRIKKYSSFTFDKIFRQTKLFRQLQNIFFHLFFSDRVIYRQRAKVYALLYVIKNIIRIIDTNNPKIYCSIFTRINFLTNSYFNFSHKLLKSWIAPQIIYWLICCDFRVYL